MSFVKKELTKEEAQALVDKYHIASPWPGDGVDDTIVANLRLCVCDPGKDALFSVTEAGIGVAHNGIRFSEGFDSVSVLAWRDNVVRVDFYEDIIGNNEKRYIVATKIIASSNLKQYEHEMMELLCNAIPVWYTVWLSTTNQNNIYTFKSANVNYVNSEDIWNL